MTQEWACFEIGSTAIASWHLNIDMAYRMSDIITIHIMARLRCLDNNGSSISENTFICAEHADLIAAASSDEQRHIIHHGISFFQRTSYFIALRFINAI